MRRPQGGWQRATHQVDLAGAAGMQMTRALHLRTTAGEQQQTDHRTTQQSTRTQIALRSVGRRIHLPSTVANQLGQHPRRLTALGAADMLRAHHLRRRPRSACLPNGSSRGPQAGAGNRASGGASPLPTTKSLRRTAVITLVKGGSHDMAMVVKDGEGGRSNTSLS